MIFCFELNKWRISTFRKYACPKLKLSRLLLNNLFRILVQNLPALEELNSKKHTPSPTVWFLRNCGIAQNSSCRTNLSFAKTEYGNFARNDFCEWLRKLLFFRAKLMSKERKIFRFVPQKICEWKPYLKHYFFASTPSNKIFLTCIMCNVQFELLNIIQYTINIHVYCIGKDWLHFHKNQNHSCIKKNVLNQYYLIMTGNIYFSLKN